MCKNLAQFGGKDEVGDGCARIQESWRSGRGWKRRNVTFVSLHGGR